MEAGHFISRQRAISISVSFSKNRSLMGFDFSGRNRSVTVGIKQFKGGVTAARTTRPTFAAFVRRGGILCESQAGTERSSTHQSGSYEQVFPHLNSPFQDGLLIKPF
jgi:hypothetical protein